MCGMPWCARCCPCSCRSIDLNGNQSIVWSHMGGIGNCGQRTAERYNEESGQVNIDGDIEDDERHQGFLLHSDDARSVFDVGESPVVKLVPGNAFSSW